MARHRKLALAKRLTFDWFGINLEWFAGFAPVAVALAIAGIFDFIPGFEQNLWWLSYAIPFWSIPLIPILIVFGIWFRLRTIATKLKKIDPVAAEGRVFSYILYEYLAISFGIIFGVLGLFSSAIPPDKIWIKAELIIMALIAPNLMSILGRTQIGESIIGIHFVRLVKNFIKKLR